VKNFDGWNEKKKYFENNINNYLFIHEREIWWGSVGINMGDEEDGKNEEFERPVLILKKFNNKVAWILPMSTKPGHKNYYIKALYQGEISYVILSQLRLISVKRLRRFVGKLSLSQFRIIRNKLIEFLK
jgi:mRNA interferase MazF